MKIQQALVISILAAMTMAATAKADGTAEQRQACEGDAMKLCKDDIPDAQKIEACMRGKMTELSPACRAEFEKGSKK